MGGNPLLASNIRQHRNAVLLLLELRDLRVLLLDSLLESTLLRAESLKLLFEVGHTRLALAELLSVLAIGLRLVLPATGLGLEVLLLLKKLGNHSCGFLVILLELGDNLFDSRHGVPFGKEQRHGCSWISSPFGRGQLEISSHPLRTHA